MNYSRFVKELVASPDISLNQIEANHPRSIHYLHSSIGLLLEVIELQHAWNLDDFSNLNEELGDVEFYSTYAASLLGYYDTRDIVDAPILDGLAPKTKGIELVLHELVLYSSDMVDLVKKHILYGQDFNYAKYLAAMRCFMRELRNFYTLVGMEQLEVRQNNINKLSTRYENGFSTEASELRKDKS